MGFFPPLTTQGVPSRSGIFQVVVYELSVLRERHVLTTPNIALAIFIMAFVGVVRKSQAVLSSGPPITRATLRSLQIRGSDRPGQKICFGGPSDGEELFDTWAFGVSVAMSKGNPDRQLSMYVVASSP